MWTARSKTVLFKAIKYSGSQPRRTFTRNVIDIDLLLPCVHTNELENFLLLSCSTKSETSTHEKSRKIFCFDSRVSPSIIHRQNGNELSQQWEALNAIKYSFDKAWVKHPANKNFQTSFWRKISWKHLQHPEVDVAQQRTKKKLEAFFSMASLAAHPWFLFITFQKHRNRFRNEARFTSHHNWAQFSAPCTSTAALSLNFFFFPPLYDSIKVYANDNSSRGSGENGCSERKRRFEFSGLSFQTVMSFEDLGLRWRHNNELFPGFYRADVVLTPNLSPTFRKSYLMLIAFHSGGNSYSLIVTLENCFSDPPHLMVSGWVMFF